MRDRAKAFAMARIEAAAAAGHTIGLEHRDPPAEWADQARTKWWGTCSCGWKSTARFSNKTAIGAAFHHLGLVDDEIKAANAARINGGAPQRVSGSPRPVAP